MSPTVTTPNASSPLRDIVRRKTFAHCCIYLCVCNSFRWLENMSTVPSPRSPKTDLHKVFGGFWKIRDYVSLCFWHFICKGPTLRWIEWPSRIFIHPDGCVGSLSVHQMPPVVSSSQKSHQQIGFLKEQSFQNFYMVGTYDRYKWSFGPPINGVRSRSLGV